MLNQSTAGSKVNPTSCLSRQRGISSLGLLVYICFFAMVLVGVLKILPVYLENQKILSVLNGVAEGFANEEKAPSKKAIEKKLAKRFAIESIQVISIEELDFERDGRIWTVDAGYETRVPLYQNIALIIDFSQSNRIQIPPQKFAN